MVYPVSMATREQVWTITITKSNGYWLRAYCVLCLCSSFTQPESVKSSVKSTALRPSLGWGFAELVITCLWYTELWAQSPASLQTGHDGTGLLSLHSRSPEVGAGIKSSESLFLIGREFQDSLSHRKFCFKIKVRQNEDSRPPQQQQPFSSTLPSSEQSLGFHSFRNAGQ